MNKMLVSPQKMCKDIDKAIKVDKEFMYSVDAKVASMSLILPPAEKTNKKTKWGKINSCSKIYKELKTLKKAVVSYKVSLKEGNASTYDDCKLDLALTNFTLKFKEIVKNIILSKIVSPKEDRAFWSELLNLFDAIGLQIANDCELFSTLGRFEIALKKKKEKEAQEELQRLNEHIRNLKEAQEELKSDIVEEVAPDVVAPAIENDLERSL